MDKGENQQNSSIWDILDLPTICPGERRKLIRPVIHMGAAVFSVIVHLAITGLVSFALSSGVYFKLQNNHTIVMNRFDTFLICSLACYFLLLLIRAKKIMIFFVELYQAKASDEVRLRCVFTPSCSEYMILSIKKYGALIGLIKGIKRLFRCRNSCGIGGEDYP